MRLLGDVVCACVSAHVCVWARALLASCPDAQHGLRLSS